MRKRREKNAALFDPLTINGITLRNRIGVSPMCQYSAHGRRGHGLAPGAPGRARGGRCRSDHRRGHGGFAGGPDYAATSASGRTNTSSRLRASSASSSSRAQCRASRSPTPVARQPPPRLGRRRPPGRRSAGVAGRWPQSLPFAEAHQSPASRESRDP